MSTKAEIREEMGKEIKEFVMGIAMTKAVMDVAEEGLGDALVDVIVEELEKLRSVPYIRGCEENKFKGKRKAMLSQPMGGKTDEEIKATRERAMDALSGLGYEVVNTLFTDEWYSKEAMESRGVVQIPLCFLAKSLENMSLCHAAYFCKGWENARGCRIEHEAAVAYGLEIIYEE